MFLYDIDQKRLGVIAGLCGGKVTNRIEEAVDGADFVISSIRAGGMEARAKDEKICNDYGLAGQETTGPGGFAMALRTIPVSLEYARVVEKYAPKCWFINFTNPAGLITQALLAHSSLKVIGICDTPAELFHQIAWKLGEPFEDMEFSYSGLNHLGWVQRVLVRGSEVKFEWDGLFPTELIRELGVIPTEYLFFYYMASKALANQRLTGATRGAEILRLNEDFFAQKPDLKAYKTYLNRRNASYMRLESEGGSALTEPDHDWDPFEGATGYHRIAIDVMNALSGKPNNIVVNVRNGNTLDFLEPDDVVEVPCRVDENGATPLPTLPLPDHAQRLVAAVKNYERLAIRASVEKSFELARWSLFSNPLVSDWEKADALTRAFIESDPRLLAYLRSS